MSGAANWSGRWSPSQLVDAAYCEWAYIALREGWPRPETPAWLQRAFELGNQHEARQLEAYRAQFPGAVVEFAHTTDPEALAQTAAATLEAMRDGAPVIYQGLCLTDEFLGWSDFLLRQTDGTYQVQDTKLSRTVRGSALLQLAAYADHFRDLGAPMGDDVCVILGTGEQAVVPVTQIEPIYRNRAARLTEIYTERRAETEPLTWGDPRYSACTRCDVCREAIALSGDLLAVSGMNRHRRHLLLEAGIETVSELASTETRAVEGLSPRLFSQLKTQARLQGADSSVPEYELLASSSSLLPPPDQGDLFLDLLTDPYFVEGDEAGLTYRFNLLLRTSSDDEALTFSSGPATTLAEECSVFTRAMTFLLGRLRQRPGARVYHFGAGTVRRLEALAERHQIFGDEVAELSVGGYLLDLREVVRRNVVVGVPEYTLGALEPLYLGDAFEPEVSDATADLAVLFADGSADAVTEIARVGEYRARSLAGLREWLLALSGGAARDSAPGTDLTWFEGHRRQQRLALTERLLRFADRDPAAALAAAATEFYPREDRQYYADLAALRTLPAAELAGGRDVFLASEGVATGPFGQIQLPFRRVRGRELVLRGLWTRGSTLGVGDDVWVMYPQRVDGLEGIRPRAAHYPIFAGQITAVDVDAETVSVVEEQGRRDVEATANAEPFALIKGRPIAVQNIAAAVESWAARFATDLEATLGGASAELLDSHDIATQVLRRTPPSVRNNDIATTLLALDHSYLAVQGPPGTGKTFTAGRVIADLVKNHGWNVAVTGQSHAVIENVLHAAMDAGVPAAQVGKKTQSSLRGDRAFTLAASYPDFAQATEGLGRVWGTTLWDLVPTQRFSPPAWDLLVIDEAGQFSLPATIAAIGRARRVLFLGDPQQLPQVTVGMHPTEIQTSALGWIAHGHDVLPEEFGFFLPETYRMHPALTERVSRLSYEGKLLSSPVTANRHLAGIEPGLHPFPVPHRGNAVESVEEATKVVELVRDLVGRAWSDATGSDATADTRPLDPTDIMVIVAYNAQRELITQALADAGFPQVPVGTVDKFQGQEAAVALISLAASDATEASRGLEFLLNRNRLNVAISRAQYAAYLVYSPYLFDQIPADAARLADLAAFAQLVREEKD